MAWFFAQENINGTDLLITDEDAKHIEKSLRMRKGEELTLVSPDATQHLCVIEDFTAEGVLVSIKASQPCEQEASVQVTLYQSLTKGEKMDLIVQKAVELGVHRIVPVETLRCVSRPDEKSLRKKTERWQKIANSAAQQSCRGIVPRVLPCISFKEAVAESKENDLSIVFYEGGGESLSSLISKDIKTVAIFVGCEGGFDVSEVNLAKEAGVVSATLGKRILRAETAPLAGVSAIMCLTGNFD